MKKSILLAFAFILLTVSSLPAQTWYPANQKTIAWDTVTTDDTGNPLPAGTMVSYRVYYKTTLATTPVFVIELAVNQVTLTMPNEGSYFVGASAIRKEGEILVGESSTSWSDNPDRCQGGETFGIRFYKLPSDPHNLRPVASDVQVPLRAAKPSNK